MSPHVQSINNISNKLVSNLRSLATKNEYGLTEAYDLANLQTQELLSATENKDHLIHLISSQPKILVVYETNLPVYGSAHWNGQFWIIVIDGSESRFNQFFSLVHEFKHILDHPMKQYLYTYKNPALAQSIAEDVADYFSECLME